MSHLLKSPDDSVWQALSRQERRAFNRYTNLSAQAATVDRGTPEIHDILREARRYWRRTVRECDAYSARKPDAYSRRPGAPLN